MVTPQTGQIGGRSSSTLEIDPQDRASERWATDLREAGGGEDAGVTHVAAEDCLEVVPGCLVRGHDVHADILPTRNLFGPPGQRAS